jgi:hypothetical protein
MEEGIKGFLLIIMAIVLIAVFSLILAYPVMWCWNYSVVTIFKLPIITWCQAWCLMFLTNILIKSTSSYSKN